MATKEQIDALKIGDKLHVHKGVWGWIEVVLTERNDEDKKTHLEKLIEQNGYVNIRLPGEL